MLENYGKIILMMKNKFLVNLLALGGEHVNIEIQVCGLVLLAVLLIFYFKQKKLYLATEKAFIRGFFAMFISIILDILSIVLLVGQDKIPDLWVELVCKLYLVSLVSVIFFALLYVCLDIYKQRADYRKKVYLFTALFAVGSIGILAAPIRCTWKKKYSIPVDPVRILDILRGFCSLSLFCA